MRGAYLSTHRRDRGGGGGGSAGGGGGGGQGGRSRLHGAGRLLHVPVLHGGQRALERVALCLVLQHRERGGQQALRRARRRGRAGGRSCHFGFFSPRCGFGERAADVRRPEREVDPLAAGSGGDREGLAHLDVSGCLKRVDRALEARESWRVFIFLGVLSCRCHRRLLLSAGFLLRLRCPRRRRGARRDVDLRRQHGHELVFLFVFFLFVFVGLLLGAGPLGGRVCFFCRYFLVQGEEGGERERQVAARRRRRQIEKSNCLREREREKKNER